MQGIKNFFEEKNQLKNLITSCLTIVNEYERKLNTNFSFYKEKLEKALKELDNEKIKIALFGSFSDGKSTILAALTGNLGIEIAPDPTTDRVKTYHFKDLYIIDTPGLFSENIPHDEETKKFISEADLIIFTTEAVNPLKESQHKVIKWILKDLGKISQTVFVINKMDTVADVYDEEDFKKRCQIKKETVINTLNKILAEERQDYIILCLSADPFGMGLEYWFQNREEYRKISRIDQLEEIILNIAKEKGQYLKKKTIEAILKDVSIRSNKEFSEIIKQLERAIKALEIEYEELANQVRFIQKEVRKASTRIKERLQSLRKVIITEIHACNDFNCLKEVYDKEIGVEGNVLKTSIELIIEQELEPVYDYISNTISILDRLNKNLEEIELLNLELAKFGAGLIKKTGGILRSTSVNTLRAAIINIRNFLKLPVKFKPWGAIKFARALQWLGAALEAIALIAQIAAWIYFNKKKEEIIKNLDRFFEEVINSIDDSFLKKNYLSPLCDLEKAEQELRNLLEEQKNLLRNYQEAQVIFNKCKEVLQ